LCAGERLAPAAAGAGDQARLAAIAGRRLASASAAAEMPKPQSAAALALVTSSRPEASEKLIV
jgi:hypothetical protein